MEKFAVERLRAEVCPSRDRRRRGAQARASEALMEKVRDDCAHEASPSLRRRFRRSHRARLPWRICSPTTTGSCPRLPRDPREPDRRGSHPARGALQRRGSRRSRFSVTCDSEKGQSRRRVQGSQRLSYRAGYPILGRSSASMYVAAVIVRNLERQEVEAYRRAGSARRSTCSPSARAAAAQKRRGLAITITDRSPPCLDLSNLRRRCRASRGCAARRCSPRGVSSTGHALESDGRRSNPAAGVNRDSRRSRRGSGAQDVAQRFKLPPRST